MRENFEILYNNRYPNNKVTELHNGNYSGFIKQTAWKAFILVESYGGLEQAVIRCFPAKFITMEVYNELKSAIEIVEGLHEGIS